MSLLKRPVCPSCGRAETKLMKHPADLARLTAAAAAGFFVGDVVALRWRCVNCGDAFLALGDNAAGKRTRQGFPVDRPDVPPKT